MTETLQYGGDRSRGLTLVELLAVIVLLSLATGVASVSLSATSTTAALRMAVADWRQMDGFARVHARCHRQSARASGGGSEVVTMSVGADGESISVHSAIDGSSLATRPFARGVVADVDAALLGFDRLGRSADYEVTLCVGDRITVVHVAGLTGLVREVTP